MRARAARGAGVAFVLAVALLLTGCGGDDGNGGGGTGGGGTGGGGGSPAAGGGAPGTAEADDGIPEDTVPTDQLTPPEGQFTDEEREYLTDRVPAGTDPGAILQLGSEACDRIGYLDRHDPEGAVTALRDGEIPDAEAAIEHLCPEYADLLEQAR